MPAHLPAGRVQAAGCAGVPAAAGAAAPVAPAAGVPRREPEQPERAVHLRPAHLRHDHAAVLTVCPCLAHRPPC